MNSTCFVVMGVCGCGKSTFGRAFSQRLNICFVDADDYHSQKNKEKMANGIALDDKDRIPWLINLQNVIAQHITQNKSLVLACSALKQKYRDILSSKLTPQQTYKTTFIHLTGSKEEITQRMNIRKNHFMNAKLVESQFLTLEPPTNAISILISLPLEEQLHLCEKKVRAT